MSTTTSEHFSVHTELSREQVEAFIAQVKSIESSDPAKAQGIARQFYEQYLDHSPSDIVASASDMYDLLSQSRDSKALMPTLAASLVGELGYQAGFANKEYFRELASRVKQTSPEQGIISMLMYRDVLSEAASVTFDIGRHVAMGFEDVFDEVLDDPELPVFSKIIARASKHSVESIVHDPERSFVQMANDPRNGKFSTGHELGNVKDAAAELAGKFLSPADGRSTFLVRLSSDMVGVVDHAGVPLMVAPLDRLREQQQKAVPGVGRRLLSDLASIAGTPLENLRPEALLTKMNFWSGQSDALRAGLAPSALIEDTSKEFDDEVRRCTVIFDEVNSMRYDLEAEKRHETEERALQATRKICEEALADAKISEVIHTRWANDLQEAEALIRENNEYGYEMLLNLVERAEGATMSREDMLAYLQGGRKKSYIATLHERHAEIHREAAEQSVGIELSDDVTHAYDTLNLYLEKLEQQWPSVRSKIWQLHSELVSQMAALDFTDIDASAIQNPSMFRAIHETYVSNEFTREFGFSLNELSISAQQHAIEYMLRRKEDEFSRLKQVLETRTLEDRVPLFEAFVATEFGDELGESIVSIAEKSRDEALPRELFSSINGIRDNLKDFGEKTWFNDASGDFKGYFEGIRRSIEQRVSEIVSPVPDLLDGKELRATQYSNGYEVAGYEPVESVSDVAAELKLLELATHKMTQAETDTYDDADASSSPEFGRFASTESDVAVTTRPVGSEAGEARVAWTVAITPEEQRMIFGEVIEFTKKGAPKTGKLTLRVDLEDSTGRLSLDIGGTHVDGQEINRRTALVVSLGAQHLARRRGESGNVDYHVRDNFDDALADPDRFERWIRWVRHDVEIWRNKRAGKTALQVVSASPRSAADERRPAA